MITVGIFGDLDELDRGRRGIRFAPAGLVRCGPDLTLLSMRGREATGDWSDVAAMAARAAELGLGLVIRTRRRGLPEGWFEGLGTSCPVACLVGDLVRGWQGQAWVEGRLEPVEQVVFLDRGIRFTASASASQPTPEAAPELWVRVQEAVGDTFDRIREERLLCPAAGRAQTWLTAIAASTGFWDFALVDDDVLEARNRSGPLGTAPVNPGPKARVLARYLRNHFQGVRVQEVISSASQRPVRGPLSRRPVLVTAGDSEALAFLGACYAATYGLAHLNVGIGAREEDGEETLRGGEVVFIPPGLGCLVCVRGVQWEEVHRDLAGDADSQLQRRRSGERLQQQTGSLPDLLARVTGTGVGLVRQWLAGEESQVRRLVLFDRGTSEELAPALPQERCPVCGMGMCGEAFLNAVFPEVPDVNHSGLRGEVGPLGRPAADYAGDRQLVERVLELTGAATVELLAGREQGQVADELATLLASEGLGLEVAAPLGPALQERLPQASSGLLSLGAVSDTEEVWWVDGALGQGAIRFRPERRWARIAQLVEQQFNSS